ncbi:MAG: ABC transporter substrate-binding protein [Deltaproteobacteria bacterium]|nr:ABC transporter substrate-binding protein [Deltaproteobacteria bacterium]
MARGLLLALVLSLGLGLGAGAAQAADPVTITVGYQPYDTISYSAAVIRAKELWKKYLPAGTEVEFEAALQGSIIVNAMVADKQQIGYLGDMPAVVSTTKTSVAPIKLVASLGLSAGQRCNVVMVRSDAPDFKNPDEAVKWLDGKTLATPKGSCADRFLRNVIAKTGIKPKEVLNQSLEVIATNFRVKKIDAAVLWEPTVSRIGDLVGEGVAKIVVTGFTFDTPDAGFIAMRSEFVEKHPDLAKAWLQAELEAQEFILNPKNWNEVAQIVTAQTTGITPAMAWYSIFGKVPANCGGAPQRDTKPFVFTPQVHELLTGTYIFLRAAKVIAVDKAPEGAIDDSLARQVVAEAHAPTPLGVIEPLDASQAPK